MAGLWIGDVAFVWNGRNDHSLVPREQRIRDLACNGNHLNCRTYGGSTQMRSALKADGPVIGKRKGPRTVFSTAATTSASQKYTSLYFCSQFLYHLLWVTSTTHIVFIKLMTAISKPITKSMSTIVM